MDIMKEFTTHVLSPIITAFLIFLLLRYSKKKETFIRREIIHDVSVSLREDLKEISDNCDKKRAVQWTKINANSKKGHEHDLLFKGLNGHLKNLDQNVQRLLPGGK